MKSVLLQFEENDRRIFWVSILFFICSLSLYIYFLGVSVFAVIERKGAERQFSTLTASISNLESKYVVLDRKINLALAHDRGFVDISVPQYVASDATEKTFTLRTEQSSE